MKIAIISVLLLHLGAAAPLCVDMAQQSELEWVEPKCHPLDELRVWGEYESKRQTLRRSIPVETPGQPPEPGVSPVDKR